MQRDVREREEHPGNLKLKFSNHVRQDKDCDSLLARSCFPDSLSLYQTWSGRNVYMSSNQLSD
jgi:hypothetical protein